MAKKKQNNVTLLTGGALALVFVIAAIMFMLTQYEVNAIIKTIPYNGFKVAFGTDDSEGKLIFALAFLFSICGAVIACLAALKVLKVKPKMLFAVLVILALIAIVSYLVVYFQTTSSLKDDSLGIDLNELLKWTFAFWFGFILHIIALLGSIFGVLKAK